MAKKTEYRNRISVKIGFFQLCPGALATVHVDLIFSELGKSARLFLKLAARNLTLLIVHLFFTFQVIKLFLIKLKFCVISPNIVQDINR